jgi:xylan 1,4-beta-xylosidase
MLFRSVTLFVLVASLVGSGLLPAEPPRYATICNPLDLPYRFEPAGPSRREAADPTVVFYQGEYWLFASKIGGYLHSPDFVHWTLVEPTGLPLESYAPTVEVIDGHLYFAAWGSGIYTTDNPALGKWTIVSKNFTVGGDPDLFLDDDGRLYLYNGCSDRSPIRGQELDRSQAFKPIGPAVSLISADRQHHGWEVRRPPEVTGNPETDGKDPHLAPWIEGSWMNKVDGRYYLQYSAPATELDNYADGVYVGDQPLGPFTYQPYNPFSYKPTGFARGAGHSSTFKGAKGNYWHIGTIAIAKRHRFERRLGVYPVYFFPDGQMACDTYLGDYPQYAPGVADHPFTSNSPGWMLLSLNKAVTASSELPNHSAKLAVDENIRDWWSAATGNPQEWIRVDLGSECRIEALQLNFADEGSTQLGRLRGDAYRYLVEVSNDDSQWKTLVDQQNNMTDAPHAYVQLDAPVMERYVRITNLHAPAGARFSLSGLRVFGNALGSIPDTVQGITAQRNASDERRVHLSWAASPGAEFYIVRYGVKSDRLYSNYQVYNATNLDINALNAGVSYFFTVDAVNASGIASGPGPVPVAATP